MNKNLRSPQQCIRFNKPYIVGYMSVDVLREYHRDLSELKYITSIPNGKLAYDLNHNMEEAIKRTTDENVEKILLLLRFLVDQKHRFKFLSRVKNWTTFITYRRTLINVIYSAFNPKQQSIVASLFNNCIYLCSLLTPEEVQRKKSRSDQEKKYCAWGYKFEQYMSSDSPNVPQDIEKPVIENAEFSMYYCSKLGQHRILYGAQIDGLLATNVTPVKPETGDVEDNLNYLRSNEFVELKTNKEIKHWRQEANLKKYKMLDCWGQCYLAGLKGLLLGYRNDNGIINKLEWFDTEDIVKYCKHEWDPQTALNYLNYFLTFVEDNFKTLRQTCDGDFDPKKPITLQFNIDSYKNISVHKNIPEDHLILPDWYVNAINE